MLAIYFSTWEIQWTSTICKSCVLKLQKIVNLPSNIFQRPFLPSSTVFWLIVNLSETADNGRMLLGKWSVLWSKCDWIHSLWMLAMLVYNKVYAKDSRWDSLKNSLLQIVHGVSTMNQNSKGSTLNHNIQFYQ